MFIVLLQLTRPIVTWPFPVSPEFSFPLTAYIPAIPHLMPFLGPFPGSPLSLPVPRHRLFSLPGMSCAFFSIWRPLMKFKIFPSHHSDFFFYSILLSFVMAPYSFFFKYVYIYPLTFLHLPSPLA